MFLSDWGGMTVLVLLLAMAVAVPYANQVLAPESPWHLAT
jgi:hypothetical protein